MRAKHIQTLVCIATSFIISNDGLHAQSVEPFSAATTYRKSIKKDNAGNITPLTEDSRDLVFQDYSFEDLNGKLTYDPRFLAFATKDSAIDDRAPRCSGTTNWQVYWIDDYNDSVRCISYSRGAQGNGDSVNPKIGGPADDEGRYIAFESEARNLYGGKLNPTAVPTPLAGTPTATPAPTYTPVTQIVMHDRKFERVWLSTGKNKLECWVGADKGQSLEGMSGDGAKLLFTTDASNVRNNVLPECKGPLFGPTSVFVRDGENCDETADPEPPTGLGECYTSQLYDTFEFHAGPNELSPYLDDDAFHPSMSSDASTVVFDSQATIPTHFNPDISGNFDIYLWKGNKFKVISRAQVPRCSISGVLLPITNNNEPANGDSTYAKVDGNGRYVVYQSMATDLVVDQSNASMVCQETNGSGQTTYYYPHPKSTTYLATNGVSQIYLYDTVNQTTELVSRAANSSSGANGASIHPWISKDGHYIIFESTATNLLTTATTSRRNIYMYDRIQKKTYLVTPGTGGSGLTTGDATITQVSGTGLVVAFQSSASDAVPASAANGGAVDTTVQHVYLAQNACPLDTDGDGVPDCLDLCKNDVTKTEPASCGCGRAETDTDGDLIADCVDGCPNDAAKTSVGQCGCGVAETDSDNDGVPNCVDLCPSDSSKTNPGGCGCGVAETDSDGDGTSDCVDQCPSNSSKASAGVCGCSVPESDDNGNGAPDCVDPTATTQPSVPRIDITRTSLDSQPAAYQLLVLMQKFSGRVTYNATLTRGSFKKTYSKSGVIASFSKLKKGTYTFKYSVSVGSGSRKVTSKTTTITIKIPGGISAARR